MGAGVGSSHRGSCGGTSREDGVWQLADASSHPLSAISVLYNRTPDYVTKRGWQTGRSTAVRQFQGDEQCSRHISGIGSAARIVSLMHTYEHFRPAFLLRVRAEAGSDLPGSRLLGCRDRSTHSVLAILAGPNGSSGLASLEVLYAGDAPGSVAGVMQVNFRLPEYQHPLLRSHSHCRSAAH
jgi:hypothetical protein